MSPYRVCLELCVVAEAESLAAVHEWAQYELRALADRLPPGDPYGTVTQVPGTLVRRAQITPEDRP